MKLFKISTPGGTPTLVQLDPENGPLTSIEIGQSGRGRTEGIIPITGNGAGVRARKTGEEIVLVRGDWPETDGRCLTIINTVGSYDRNRSYGLFDQVGIESVKSGYIAFGDAGRINGGEEILAIVSVGAEFRLKSKYAAHWYMWDGLVWTMETPEQRSARLALAEVENGGGEWL